MFIGRKAELEVLEKMYASDTFEMLVLYGRRRVGKSTLIKEFIEGKRSAYFLAEKSDLHRNVAVWSKRVIESFEPQLSGAMLPDIDSLFSFIGEQSSSERTIIVIDELPFLATADPGFLSMLQGAIDENWSKKNMFLIICGSSVSFMEDEVLSEKSPIFGRRTGQLQLKPFDYLESAEFVPMYSYEEKAICYAVTGGIAKYLSLFDPQKNLDENIINLFFTSTGYLHEETQNLLSQEFRSIASYNDVVRTIAGGTVKISEIADKANMAQPMASHIVSNLVQIGIASKDNAITDENNKKKVQYTLKDGMFRFWYRFVPDALSMIELGKGEDYYYRNVKPKLHEYMGVEFEKMCQYHAIRMSSNDNIGCEIMKVGKWWGSDPITKLPTDIDVVGIDPLEHKAVLGECKFRNEPMDKAIYEDLRQKYRLIDKKYHVVKYLYYSLNGFSDWIKENATKDDILFSLDDMYS